MHSADQLKAQLMSLQTESDRLSRQADILSHSAHSTCARIMAEPDVVEAEKRIIDAAARVNELSQTTEAEMTDEKCYSEGLQRMQQVVREKTFILGRLNDAVLEELKVTDEDELMFEPK